MATHYIPLFQSFELYHINGGLPAGITPHLAHILYSGEVSMGCTLHVVLSFSVCTACIVEEGHVLSAMFGYRHTVAQCGE